MDLHGFAWISPQPVMFIKIWYVYYVWSGDVRSRESALFLGHLEAWVWRTRRGSCLGLGWPVTPFDSCSKLRSSAYFDMFSHFVTFFHIGERINIQIIGFLFNYWNNWHGKRVTQNGEDTRGWGWIQPCHPCTACCASGALRGWIDRTQQAWSSSHLRLLILLGLRALLQIWVCFKIWRHPRLWPF